MEVKPYTAIIAKLTPEEAHNAVTNATDLQLAIQAALYKLEPPTIVEQAAALKQRRNGHKLLPMPAAKKHKPQAQKECPYCHETRKLQGWKRHIAACQQRPTENP
jgi:hypothetical protein